MDTILKREDFKKYLGVLYFGADQPGFRRYIDRAFRDFSRTLRTTQAVKPREDRIEAAANELSARLVTIAQTKKLKATAAEFDRWHAETCESLIAVFGGGEMSYGHAQKWVNMSFKYLFTAQAVGLDDIGSLELWYAFSHLPIDNGVLDALAKAGFEHLPPRPWSKLGKDDYLAFQMALRAEYRECPMDVEFMLERGEGEPRRRGKQKTAQSAAPKPKKKTGKGKAEKRA